MRSGRIGTVIMMATLAAALALIGSATPAQVIKGARITNNDVVRMVKQRMPEATIIAAIKTGPVQFNLSHSELLALERQGVSGKVLMAMIAKSGLTPKPGTPVDPKLRVKFTVPKHGIVVKNLHSAQSSSAVIDLLRKQRQVADAEVSRMKIAVRPQSQAGMVGQQSQLMSAAGSRTTAPLVQPQTTSALTGGNKPSAATPSTTASRTMLAAPTAVQMVPRTAGVGNPGPIHTESATVNPAGASPRPGATPAINGAAVNAISSNGNRLSVMTHAVYGPVESMALICAQDPTMRITNVSGSSSSATFTPISQFNLYTITGCSFGNPGPSDQVYIYGTGAFRGNFVIKFWSDNSIVVSLDSSISGVPDLNNLTLVVQRADLQQAQKSGFEFYAAREWVPLSTIPQSWVTLASFGGFICGSGSYNKCWGTNYSSPPASPPPSWLDPPIYPTPANVPPGPSARSAYVSRSSNGLKNESLASTNDYYDFSHLAPGWTTDPSDQQHQPQVTIYDQYCPSGNGWTVTYKQSFGTWSAQWDGNNLEIGLSETSCSGFLFPGFDNYQNWSGSYYALKVWVTGPRGTDPFTDNPTH